jgi:hypothetical protein
MKEQVRILKEIQRIDFPSRPLGPWEKGEEAEIWHWEAKVLERRGLIERRRVTPTDVRRLIIAEERSSNPEKLPTDFYLSVRERISDLHKSGGHEEADELKSRVLTLLEVRIPKLLKFVLLPEESGEILPEEKFLINRLALVYRTWSQKLERFLEAGEEVNRDDVRGTIRHDSAE